MAFAMTYLPFANGGEYMLPSFVEPVDPAKVVRKRVMSAQTAATVLDMMRVTVLEGSGKNAEARGYEVAGKTGTAEKPTPNGYDPDRNITSFAAIFPASRPQYVVLVVLDEAQPRTGAQTHGRLHGGGDRRKGDRACSSPPGCSACARSDGDACACLGR